MKRLVVVGLVLIVAFGCKQKRETAAETHTSAPETSATTTTSAESGERTVVFPTETVGGDLTTTETTTVRHGSSYQSGAVGTAGPTGTLGNTSTAAPPTKKQ